jgi:hypothetical protein
MVEHGVIKVYFGSRSVRKARYGFIQVTGEDGQPTGEEVYFHLNKARLAFITRYTSQEEFRVEFAANRATLADLKGEPLKGDKVVFEAVAGSPNRRVVAWTLAELWEDEELYLEEARCGVEEEEMEECSGNCGQTKATCTCAELASLRAHNPADGYWTA